MGSSSNKHVGLGQQQTGKTESILLASGKLLGFQRPLIAIKAESLQDRFGLGGVLESAFVLKLMLQIAVTLEHLFQIVTHFGHAMLELVHLMFDLLQTTESRECRFVHGRSRVRNERAGPTNPA